MTSKNPGLYAIIDVIAQDVVQNVITICRHEAPMVRMFTDLLAGKQGPIGQHPADYQLVRLATIDDTMLVSDGDKWETIITGKQWLASQEHSAPPSGNTNRANQGGAS